MKVVIIVPTYNERSNIALLIAALQDEFARMTHDMHILVVDDKSPDGTGDVVLNLMTLYRNLYLLEGEKQGLGSAYIRGMQHAINHLGADAVFEMDADLSHDPVDVPRMMVALERADFVIGSRYVPGGSVPREWGWHRKLNSKLGNLVTRYLAGMSSVRDCTAGFRAIRASILRQIDFSVMRVKGYAFQVALLNQAISLGAVVKEIPVNFIDRKHGESKLGIDDIVEFIINAWWIRLSSLETFIKFGLVGLSGALVNLVCFTFLLAWEMNKFLASPVAIEISIIWNFLFNNYWAFRTRNNQERVRIKGLKFNIVSMLSLSISFITFSVLSLMFPRTPPQVHQLIGIIPASLANYFLNSYWTFSTVKGLQQKQHPMPDLTMAQIPTPITASDKELSAP